MQKTELKHKEDEILLAKPIDLIQEEKEIHERDKELQMARYSLDRDYLIQEEIERLEKNKERNDGTIHIREW